MAAANIPAYSYHPPPTEQGYYESLFAAADQARSGQLNGRDAVGFLSRSKLPVDLLKNIWTIADQNPKTNFLDKNKFFVSVRLIQFYQNGQSPQGPNLEADSAIMMRPPYFEGVTGASAQPFTPGAPSNHNQAAPTPPVPSQQPTPSTQNMPTMPDTSIMPHQHIPTSPPTPQRSMHASVRQTALAAQDPYSMLPAEQVRYENLFPQYAADGFVYGAQAVDLFSKSGLGKEVLRDIWNLVDNPVDNRLSKVEFAIAMHLIICVSKKNLPLPKLLPPSLKDLNDSTTMEPAATHVSPTLAPPSSTSPHAVGSVLPPLVSSQTATPGNRNGGQQGMQHNQNANSNRNIYQNQRLSIHDAFNEIPLVGSPPISPTTMEKAGVQVQVHPYAQNPSSEPVQPPPEISINENNKYSASIVSGIPASPALSSLPQNSIVPELPNLTYRALSPNHGGNEIAELDRCRSVLQKLQAENISLKAQLGQFTEEEQRVQQDIKQTVVEIGSLSQELTSLRNEVVDAKASLIEATSELKAQIEKRDTLIELVRETSATKAAIENGSLRIREVEAAAKAKAQPQPQRSSSSDEGHSDFFVFDAGGQSSNNSLNRSVNNDGYVDVPAPYYGGDNQTNSHCEVTSDYTHMQPQIEQPSGRDEDTTTYQTSAPLPVVDEKSHMIKEELEQLKSNLENIEMDAKSAEMRTRDFFSQLNELRVDIEKSTELILEKRNQLEVKRKGFMRGRNKILKREIDIAEQETLEKNNILLETETSYGTSQSEYETLNKQAEEIRREIEVRESILLQQKAQLSTEHKRDGVGNEPNVPSVANAEATPRPHPSYPAPPPSTLIPNTSHSLNYGGHSSTPERKAARTYHEQNRSAIKSNESLSTGLSLESDQTRTSSEIRSNTTENANQHYVTAQTHAQFPPTENIASSIEYTQVSGGNAGMGYVEPLTEENNSAREPSNQTGDPSMTMRAAMGIGYPTADEQSQNNVVDGTMNCGTTMGNEHMMEQPHANSLPNSKNTLGNPSKTIGGSLAYANVMGYNNVQNELYHGLSSAQASQTDASEYGIKGGACPSVACSVGSEHSAKGGACSSVAPSVVSDPGYKGYVDSTGNGSHNSRRASFGDMSLRRYEYEPHALGEIMESDGVGVTSLKQPNFSDLGLINESHRPVEHYVGVPNSDDVGTGMIGTSSHNNYDNAGVGISKGPDVVTDYGRIYGSNNNMDSVYSEPFGDINTTSSNTAGSADGRSISGNTGSSLVDDCNMTTSTMRGNNGGILTPKDCDKGTGIRNSISPSSHNMAPTFGDINTTSSNAVGSVDDRSLTGQKSNDTASSLVRDYDVGPGIGYGIAQNDAVASNFGEISAPRSDDVGSGFVHMNDITNCKSGGSLGGSYASASNLGISRPRSTDTASSLLRDSNIMTSSTGSSQGGIPMPRNYNDGLDDGNRITPKINAVAPTFTGISAPMSDDSGSGFGYSNDGGSGFGYSNDTGSGFGYSNDITNSKSGASVGGSYESTNNSIGISGPKSTDTASSHVGWGDIMTSTTGASQGSIPTSTNYNGKPGIGDGIATNDAMISTFGTIPETSSRDNLVTSNIGKSQGGVPSIDYDFGQGNLESTTSYSNPMGPNYGVIPTLKSDDAVAASGSSSAYGNDTTNYKRVGSPVISVKSGGSAINIDGIGNATQNGSGLGNNESQNLPNSDFGGFDMRSKEDSEDRIPSPSGSFSYDYGNPFLQS